MDYIVCPDCNNRIYPTRYCSNCGKRLFEHNYNYEKRRREYKWNIVVDNDKGDD